MNSSFINSLSSVTRVLLFVTTILTTVNGAVVKTLVKVDQTVNGVRYQYTWTADAPSGLKGASMQFFDGTSWSYTAGPAGGGVTSPQADIGAINWTGMITVPFGASGAKLAFNSLSNCTANACGWVTEYPGEGNGNLDSASVTNPWATTVKYFNDKPYPVTIRITKNGTLYGTYTVAANTLFGQTFETWDATKPTFIAYVEKDGLAYGVDGSWTVAPAGTVFTALNSSINPDKVVNNEAAGGSGTTASTTTIPSTTNLPAAMPTSVNASNVWRTQTGNVTTDGLTNSTFREGIDKVTARQDTQINYQKKLDEKQTADKTALDANTESVVKTAALAAGEATKNAYRAAMGNTTATTGASGGSSSMSIALAGTGITANLAPWDDSTLHTVAQVVKAVITAFIFFYYCKWQAARFKEYMATLAIAPQAKGNTVAGTGGQITALLSAVIITFILVTAPVALVALSDTGLGWGSNLNLFGGLASNSIGKMGFDILSEFFPIDTAVTAMSGQLVTLIAGTAICTGFAAAIRYVIPAIAILVALAQPSDAKADVIVHNLSAESVDVHNGSTTTTVLSGTTGAVPYIGASLFTFDGASIETARREVLDNAVVDYHGDFTIAITFPASVWWVYVVKGFVVGCLFELAGMAIRFLGRATASVETV